MSFTSILGQDRAKKFLQQVMAREKIPHAYLFSGMEGVGKTSTAKALTEALNCREPAGRDACGECAICRQMKSGNFPDFLNIYPDGQNIKIEQIRELNRILGFAPAAGGYRVCVLHQAERMNKEASNAFLKTLEEPPPGNILILKAAEPLDLLPTIVSRCQKVPFQPLPCEVISNTLAARGTVQKEDAGILARLAGGSLGWALDAGKSGFFERRREWLAGAVRMPSLAPEELLAMTIKWTKGNSPKDGEASKPLPEGLNGFLLVWSSWFRDLMLLKAGIAEDLLANIDFSGKLKNLADKYSMEALITALEALEQAKRDLRRNRNPLLVMEYTMLRVRSKITSQ